MSNARFILVNGLLLLSAVSCNSPTGDTGGAICTAEARPALSVFVRDSSSGAPIGRGSTVTATDGVFTVTGVYPAGSQDDLAFGLAPERPGTYTVNVSRPNYGSWRVTGVRVTRDECHVRTETLIARLQANTVM